MNKHVFDRCPAGEWVMTQSRSVTDSGVTKNLSSSARIRKPDVIATCGDLVACSFNMPPHFFASHLPFTPSHSAQADCMVSFQDYGSDVRQIALCRSSTKEHWATIYAYSQNGDCGRVYAPVSSSTSEPTSILGLHFSGFKADIPVCYAHLS